MSQMNSLMTYLRRREGNRMSSTLSHDAVKPSGGVVSPVINRLATSGSSDIPAFDVGSEIPPHYRNSNPVKLIGRVINITQVAKSVVCPVMVDVVNHIRLLIVSKKPADSMSLVENALVLQPKIAISISPASTSALGLARGISQKPRFRVVVKAIANRIRDNLSSHFVLPHNLVRGLAVVAVSTPILLFSSGCSTTLGNERSAQHAADQVRIVAVQREAMEKEALFESQEKAALYEAIANVAATNPQQSSAALVALAVIGVRGDESGPDAPLVGLQRQENVGLEYVKALAPTVGGLITGVGIAAINAETQRNASDNNRDILLGDQIADRGIVEAVAGLGSVAAAQTGIEVSGDYYDLEDSASVDNSTVTTTSEDTTTTTTTSYSMNTTLDYEGTTMTLSELITELKSAGATYSIDLNNDGVPDVSGGSGRTAVTEINCAVTFAPRPPQCQ
jgi:hypothetical protein